jgi:putative flippase GtrA
MWAYFSRDLLLKFLKFGVVGFTGMLVDFSVTYIFKEWIKVQKYVANAIGFTVAASTNYVLNRYWTFHSHNPEIALEFSRFFIVSLLGLAINTFVIWAIVKKFKSNFYFAKLIAIGVVTIWNFFANLAFTFV